MHVLDGGALRLGDAWANRLAVNYWTAGGWQALALTGAHGRYAATGGGIDARLEIIKKGDGWTYRLTFTASFPTRLQLALELPEAQQPFHLIPAVIFGDNNLAGAEPGHYPNLTLEHPGNVSCSSYWEARADRASHPVSLLLFDGGIAGISIDPYAESRPEDGAEAFVRNGLFAQLAHDGSPHACGVTLGYRNTPRTFVNKQEWAESTEHRMREGTVGGRIFLQQAASRLEAHGIIRQVYRDYHQAPEEPMSRREAVSALTHAFLTVNWQPEREHFTNMRCIDPAKKTLTPWRTLAEVGWTGGGTIAYPLLVAGHLLGDSEALERARYLLDWVARACNPASGLLWDVCGKHEGAGVNWWWSGLIVQDCHCAYTNGNGLYYLLKALSFSQNALSEDHPEWLDTACRVLDTMTKLQLPTGSFGYTYSTERPEILDAEGYAGVWFVPALVLAWQQTGREAYLQAARRGLAFYHQAVRDLTCSGTPMDTWKAVDQEGVLGFIRGAALLHQATGDAAYLSMLEDGAHYEYLWRYGFRARPQYPPLQGSPWNSCGGSVTSTSNPHIHPMGVYISAELRYLARQTGDAYHASRSEDGLGWGVNCVGLYPDISGYGIRGVLTERFCPSDGLVIETFPDGSPSSIWFSYNGWAAAAVLEGLCEDLLDVKS